MMRQVLTALILVVTILTSGLRANAAGETGHSDWMRVMFEIYGFDVEMARHLSAINQGVDNVPGAAATQSGVASEVMHFSRVITKTDLMNFFKAMKEVGNDHHDISFKSKAILAMKRLVKNQSLGDSTGAIANAASVEYLNRAVIKGDIVGQGIGTHIALDAQGFHNGYKGALHVPVLGLETIVNKIPVFRTFFNLLTTLPFGHLVDGTSVDRLTVGKMALSMYSMGDFLITMRESMKDVGVNKSWLGYLQSQGVDVNSSESIAEWFFSQPEIAKILQEQLPANKTKDYFDLVLKEVAQNLTELNFFTSQEKLAELLKEVAENREVYQQQVNRNTTYEQLAMRDLIKKAKERGFLNEQVVIRETVTDYFAIPDNSAFKKFRAYVQNEKEELLNRTATIDELVRTSWSSLPEYVQVELKRLHGDLSTEMPFSENWILDQVAEKITRNMVHYRFSKFNTAYLNEELETSHIQIERKAVVGIESIYLKLAESSQLTGKYIYNPGAEHRSKVKSELFTMANYRGMTMLEAMIKAADIIITTKVAEGSNVISIPAIVKLKIFMKTMIYLANKKASPITTKGGYFLKVKNLREMAIQYLADKNPDGILSEAEYNKIKEFNEILNRKYNSDEAVGVVQSLASGVKKSAQFMQKVLGRKNAAGALRCEAMFN